MANPLQLQVVTPQRVIFSGEVNNFTVPGSVGPFTIMNLHSPIVSALVPGLFKYEIGKTETKYIISGGFLEFHENKGTLLASAMERVEDIDLARAESAKLRAEERLRIHDGIVDLDRAHLALDRAKARIAALKPIRG